MFLLFRKRHRLSTLFKSTNPIKKVATSTSYKNINNDNKEKPIYITTPIFYVNASPHIGHLYTATIADSFKRYYELKGKKVILSTGTDEHGSKIHQAALRNNVDPKDFSDRVSQNFQELFDMANINYTTFIRTTDQRHKDAVKHFWNCLMKNGYIYKGEYEGWYSVSDETFYSDSQVEEFQDPKTKGTSMISIESRQPVEWTTEQNYKFSMAKLQNDLLEWLEKNPEVVVPQSRYNEVKAMIKMGLSDLSISRPKSRSTWGINVPDDEDQVIYVWLDALTNYLTVTNYPWLLDQDNDIWPADIHVVGKDILRFHAIYWPSFLLAANLPLPKTILAHSHWTMEKQKMSKSRGNVIDPFDLINKYGVDAIRYYLLKDGGIVDDGDFSIDNLETKYKKDLAGQLGNLLSRVVNKSINPSSFVTSTSYLFEEVDTLNDYDNTLIDKLKKLKDEVDKHYSRLEINKGITLIFDMILETNKYFHFYEPWNLIKQLNTTETKDALTIKKRMTTLIFLSIETLRITGILLLPIMPAKMEQLLDKLGIKKDKRTFEDAKLDLKNIKENVDFKNMEFQYDQEILFPKLNRNHK